MTEKKQIFCPPKNLLLRRRARMFKRTEIVPRKREETNGFSLCTGNRKELDYSRAKLRSFKL